MRFTRIEPSLLTENHARKLQEQDSLACKVVFAPASSIAYTLTFAQPVSDPIWSAARVSSDENGVREAQRMRKDQKGAIGHILSEMTPCDAPLANCFSLASPARPETERQIDKKRESGCPASCDLRCAPLMHLVIFHASLKEFQDLTTDLRERTKALEAEQVLADDPRALPP